MTVNIFQLGVAYQAGLIPLTAASIEEAIRLNDVSFEKNLQAFLWGRKYYGNAAWVDEHCKGKTETKPRGKSCGRAYAISEWRLRSRVRGVRSKSGRPGFTETVGRYLFKLMAYKDEYEVARLLTKPQFGIVDSRDVAGAGIHHV